METKIELRTVVGFLLQLTTWGEYKSSILLLDFASYNSDGFPAFFRISIAMVDDESYKETEAVELFQDCKMQKVKIF